ncbi:MAG: hypothetical protein JNL74_10900, partial [Fibrobacteres bacterium]|nr:hypothetical protein [Fibrobacterota bacterium]
AIELYYENSQLLQVIVQDPEYKNLLITEMRQYTKSDNVAYPLNINTTHYTKKGQTSEKLIIGKTYINKPIEQYNNEFKIPLGVKITDIKL